MILISLAVVVMGCINENPTDGDSSPSKGNVTINTTTNITQETEPSIKTSEEAIILIKEKYPEFSDKSKYNFTVFEMENGGNLTFWNATKECENQCLLKHYLPFIVYENGTIIKEKDYRDIEMLPVDSEIRIDLEDNDSFLIREGQRVNAMVFGEYDVSFEYINSMPIHTLKVITNWTREETPTIDKEYLIEIEYSTVPCQAGVCKYQTSPIFLEDKRGMSCNLELEILPYSWNLNGSKIVSSFGNWNTSLFYVKVHKNTELIREEFCPAGIEDVIGEGETINLSCGYSNITVNYISSSPTQVFEFIVDKEKNIFEINVTTGILSVNGIKKGKTCEAIGPEVGIKCSYWWQTKNFEVYVGPVSSQSINDLWNDKAALMYGTWNDKRLYFHIDYYGVGV